ncbi:MAG TPA: ATP-binding protein, partial [Longimicrobium sp.]|nr:ATP-binding protein [Longimicrobium sp.]
MQPNDLVIDVPRLVTRLVMSSELEWLEFKQNNHEPQEVGQYISAIANAAALHDQPVGFVVWGVKDGTNEIVGTTFCPRTQKEGGELLESWLARLLSPKLDFRFHEGEISGRRVVVLEIPCAATAPVRFEGEEYIRIGSSKKKLRDHWEKERKLWSRFSRIPFEDGIARHDVSPDDVLELIAYAKFFELLEQPVPTTTDVIRARLAAEG